MSRSTTASQPKRGGASALPTLLALLGALAGALATDPAQAARPLQTDDAGVIEAGGCEIEGGLSQGRADGSIIRSGGAAWTCGLGRDAQLGVAAGAERVEGESSRSLAVSGKLGLREAAEGDALPALALGVGGSWSREGGRGDHFDALSAVLIGSWTFDDVGVHANVGHLHRRAGLSSEMLWGLAVERPWAWREGLTVTPLAEFYGSDHGGRGATVGARWNWTATGLTVDLAIGRQLGPDAAHTVGVGFKWAF